jgi:hypothetical protein
MRSLGLVLVVALCSWTLPGQAQLDAQASTATTVAGPEADSAMRHWWLGAYFRHLEIPPYMTEPFFDRAPSVRTTASVWSRPIAPAVGSTS